MTIINETIFYDKPGSCGTCPFFYNGSTHLRPGEVKGTVGCLMKCTNHT